MARDLKTRFDGAGALRIDDVQVKRIAAATGDDIQSIRRDRRRQRVAADMTAIKPHHARDRLQIGAPLIARRWNDDSVVLPARAAKIGGGGDLQQIAVTLMVV